MFEFLKNLPGAALLLALGWVLLRRTHWVYALFRHVLGSGAFPDDGPKRASYERFLRAVGIAFLVFGILGIVIAVNLTLESWSK